MGQRTFVFCLITALIVMLSVMLSGQSRTILAQVPTDQPQIAVTQTTQATTIAPSGLEPITAENADRITQITRLRAWQDLASGMVA